MISFENLNFLTLTMIRLDEEGESCHAGPSLLRRARTFDTDSASLPGVHGEVKQWDISISHASEDKGGIRAWWHGLRVPGTNIPRVLTQRPC